jgi:hypothetical protein
MAKDLFSALNKLNPSVEKIQRKLEEAMQRSTRSNRVWKPNGEHEVRIIPYKHADGLDPFVQVFFHWELGDNVNYVVCPKNSGLREECPICDMVTNLYASKDSKQIALAKKIRARSRWYVPVVVRGEEDHGVRFWGFGADVRREFYKYVKKKGYEEPFSPTNGFDFSVEYIKPSGKEGDYGTRTIVPLITERGSIFPMPDDEDEKKEVINSIIELIDGVPNLFDDIFSPKSDDELIKIIEPIIYGTHSDDDEEDGDVISDDDSISSIDEEDDVEEDDTSNDEEDIDEDIINNILKKVDEAKSKTKK